MLLPKMTGLAERAWNPDSTYSAAQFNRVLQAEPARWVKAGYAFHVRQPGIRLLDGGAKFTVNSSYDNSVIRYTLDGSMPVASSPEIKPRQEVSCADAAQVRATQWVEGIPSVVSIVNK